MARECIFLEDFAHDMTAPDKPEETLEARSVICGDWKLVENYIVEQREIPGTYLFNLKDDPKERTNLVARLPEKAAELRVKVNAWWNPKPDRFVDTRADGIATMRMGFPGTHETNRVMTVYWPPGKQPSPNPLPAEVRFHGERGCEEEMVAVAHRGVVVVCAECRGGDAQGDVPDRCSQDEAAALEFINRHAKAWNIDPENISVKNHAGVDPASAPALLNPGGRMSCCDGCKFKERLQGVK